MDTANEIKKAIRGKGYTMEEAAEKLDISRGTLFYKLKDADNDKEFQQLVQERLGINVSNASRSSHAAAPATERKIGEVNMRYHTVTLKDKRMAELWLPADFSKVDIKTLKQWLDFVESTM